MLVTKEATHCTPRSDSRAGKTCTAEYPQLKPVRAGTPSPAARGTVAG